MSKMAMILRVIIVGIRFRGSSRAILFRRVLRVVMGFSLFYVQKKWAFIYG